MKKYIYPFLTIGLLTACVEDEGNYNYSKLNEVDIQGIEDSYAPLAYFDRVQISPVLSGSLAGEDLSNYDYEWHICTNNHTHIVISEEKDLDWPADVPPNTYNLYFIVKDRATGLEAQTSTTLVVSSPYNRGFLVLGDNMETGLVGMDLISMPPQRDTVMIEDVFVNDYGIHGAKKIQYSGQGGTQDHHPYLWLLTDDNSYKLNYDDEFSVIGELADFDFIEIDVPHKTPMHIKSIYPTQGGPKSDLTGGAFGFRARFVQGMIFDDMITMCANNATEYYSQPINRYSASSNIYFKPYPLAFLRTVETYSVDAAKMTLFYDMDNNCFAMANGPYAPYCSKVTLANREWSLDLGSQNRSLVYAENGLDTFNKYNPVYLLMKNEETGTLQIGYFSWYISLFTGTLGVYLSPLYTVNAAIAVDIESASNYMFSSNSKVLLYSVGNRLYKYDFAAGACEYIDFDGEITYLEAEYSSTCSIKEFFVATYNNTDGRGKIYKMEVADKGGLNFLKDQEWETSLRVKDIEWKIS